MKICQVFIGPNEFIGKIDQKLTDPIITLKMPVSVHVVGPGKVNLISHAKNQNYLHTEFIFHNGPGVLILPLADGSQILAKYTEAITGISIPQIVPITANSH